MTGIIEDSHSHFLQVRQHTPSTKSARQLAWGWKSPPPPRRVRGARAPEAPGHEAPTAQEGGEVGEGEAEVRIEPSPEEAGGVRSGRFLFVCFVFCSGFLVSLLFFGGYGGKEIGQPRVVSR